VPGDRVRAVQDGETIALGERELTVIYTPGHAPHHICLYEGNKRWLFAGEALGVYFPESGVVMPSVVFPNFDLELTLKDIEELRKLSTEVIFYSHSGVRQATATLFQQIEDVTKEYGEMILRDMRRGEDLEGICRSMEAHLRGAQLDLSQLGPAAMFRMVKGYMDYFRKRGVA
jgi:glyoxylase-like metal-dependent hydrolase (beta-lactamase superfamily II)